MPYRRRQRIFCCKKENGGLSFVIIENEDEYLKIVDKMLENGNPIYRSPNDIINNKSSINIIGEKTARKEFSVKKYNVFVEWSKGVPCLEQIKALKKAFPEVSCYTNKDLLEAARKCEKLMVISRYLSEREYQEYRNRGKNQNIIISMEEC